MSALCQFKLCSIPARPFNRPNPCKSPGVSSPGKLTHLSGLKNGFLRSKTLLQGALCCGSSHATHVCRLHVSQVGNWTADPESQLGVMWLFPCRPDVREMSDLKQSTHCEQMTVNTARSIWVCGITLRSCFMLGSRNTQEFQEYGEGSASPDQRKYNSELKLFPRPLTADAYEVSV